MQNESDLLDTDLLPIRTAEETCSVRNSDPNPLVMARSNDMITTPPRFWRSLPLAFAILAFLC